MRHLAHLGLAAAFTLSTTLSSRSQTPLPAPGPPTPVPGNLPR